MLKNRTTRVATLLLALTLITCCFVGSTFAKYTSDATGTDTVKVAKWTIMVGPNSDVDIAENEEITFNLFDTIYNTDDAVEDAVTTGMIAPGTKGAFTLEITNDSDVDAEYSLTFTETNVPANFKFTVNGGTAASTIADVAKTTILRGETKEVLVEWEWAFETGDDAAKATNNANDTTDGIASKTVTVTATVLVEQIDKRPVTP